MPPTSTSRWRWGEAKTIKFINFYKQQRCLWDPEDDGYKNKHTREKSYLAIVEAMQDDEITTRSVRTKIKNLRSTYHQELKKIKEAIENAGEPYTPHLCWFHEMDSFLGDLTDKRAVMEQTVHVDLPFNTFEVEENQIIKNERQSSDSELETEVNQPSEIQPEVSDASEEPPSKRQRDVAKVTNIINRLQNIATVLDGSAKAVKEDEFYFFGLNIAAQLRKLPLDVALQMQAEIQNKLYMVRAKTANGQGSKQRDVLDSD